MYNPENIEETIPLFAPKTRQKMVFRVFSAQALTNNANTDEHNAYVAECTPGPVGEARAGEQ